MNAKGLKHICRTGFAGRGPAEGLPALANRLDEVDTLLIFDNVLIPWEDVLFYQPHPGGLLTSAPRCTATAPWPSCCASSTWRT